MFFLVSSSLCQTCTNLCLGKKNGSLLISFGKHLSFWVGELRKRSGFASLLLANKLFFVEKDRANSHSNVLGMALLTQWYFREKVCGVKSCNRVWGASDLFSRSDFLCALGGERGETLETLLKTQERETKT